MLRAFELPGSREKIVGITAAADVKVHIVNCVTDNSEYVTKPTVLTVLTNRILLPTTKYLSPKPNYHIPVVGS